MFTQGSFTAGCLRTVYCFGRAFGIAGYRDGSLNQFVWNLTEEYADEILEKVEPAEAVRALGGEEALLTPRSLAKRREAPRGNQFRHATPSDG
jgi:hypothetical protein